MANRTQREVMVSKGPTTNLVDSPIPKAEAGSLVIKVAVSGSNPKDWKVPEMLDNTHNSGDDVAGTVHEIGVGVSEFKQGDRVAAFHVMRAPNGSFAEYAVAPENTTFHLAPNVSFEEGAAVPLAALTAAVGLSHRLRLPEPWVGAKEPIPLVIYGASSAVGIYTLQLALRSNIHPLICVAGRAQEYVASFLDPSKGDTIVDYRQGNAAVVQGIRDALKGQKLVYAFDAVSEHNSFQNLSQVLVQPGGKIALVLPYANYDDIPAGIERLVVTVGDVHEGLQDLGYVYSRYIARGLEQGWFKAQPQEVVPGGLEGVESALQKLKAGQASAVKYVFRIGDTPGIQS